MRAAAPGDDQVSRNSKKSATKISSRSVADSELIHAHKLSDLIAVLPEQLLRVGGVRHRDWRMECRLRDSLHQPVGRKA